MMAPANIMEEVEDILSRPDLRISAGGYFDLNKATFTSVRSFEADFF
jgi:hypothetical protein